jgi:hypothetical protein
MVAMLQMIYCFLLNMIAAFKDLWLDAWDSVLSPVDQTLAGISPGALSAPLIPDAYAWVLGATGMSQAVTIVATAMGVRFLLQSIPFVRWGS